MTFAAFSSLYEVLGGISIAFTGLNEFSRHFVSAFQERFSKFNSLAERQANHNSKAETMLLDIEIEIQNASPKAHGLIQPTLKYIENELEFVRRRLNKCRMRDKRTEYEHMRKIFKHKSLLSAIFALLFLIICGLESSSVFINEKKLLLGLSIPKNAHIIFVANLELFLLSLYIILPLASLNTRISEIITCKKKRQQVYYFLFLVILALITTLMTPIFGIFKMPSIFIVILCSFILCSLSFTSLFYRYYFYLEFRAWLVKKRLKRNESTLSNVNRLLTESVDGSF